MKLLTTLVATLVIAAATGAQTEEIEGLQGHPAQMAFWKSPCGTVIDILITDPDPALSIDATIDFLATQAVTWGHLLGVESANPGLRGDHDTILNRLRAACTENPDKTAMDLLGAFAGR